MTKPMGSRAVVLGRTLIVIQPSFIKKRKITNH